MGNEVARTNDNSIAAIIGSDKMKKQWALVLPKCLPPDRLARVALTQLRKTPKLAKCSKESFLAAMMKCAESGLEPNGRDAHLVPYGPECTFIADYKGLVRLARRDPSVKDVQVFTVRENDDFAWTPDGITHTFSLKKSRGEVVGCYTKISWENGTVSYGEPMTREEAEAIQNKSPSGKRGPWVDHFTEMWKKSVVRRDSKMWPLSPEIMDQMSTDLEDADGIEISEPAYSEEQKDPLAGMDPAEVVEEKPAAKEEEAPPAADPSKDKEVADETDASVEKLINSLKVIQKHRGDEFKDVCEKMNVPLARWEDAPTPYLEEMLERLNVMEDAGGE